MTPGGSSGPGASGARRPPFALVLAVTLTGILGNVLVVPALPDIARDLGVSTESVGLLLASTTAPGIVLAPVIGVLADRFGRRAVLLPCLVVFAVAGGLGALAPTFGVLVALRVLQGVGSAGLLNLAVVLITDHWEGAERARMIGRNAATLTASLVVVPPLGGLITEVGGWRATFVPYWVGLATAAAVASYLPVTGGGRGSLRHQLALTAQALRSWAALGPMMLGGAVFLLVFGLLTTMPVYLDDAFGLGPGGRGLVLALPAATSTAGALSIARVRARAGVPGVVAGGLVLLAAGLGSAAAAPALGAVVLGLLLYGAGEGLLIATLQTTVADRAPEESRAALVATWVGFARAGQTAGPILAGVGLGTVGARGSLAAGATLAGLLAVVHQALLRAPAARSTPADPTPF
ncbi:MAG: MFS transporter [Actinomycetota bacterium]|nr:MFS transporter [Actinomycetota bacterium]